MKPYFTTSIIALLLTVLNGCSQSSKPESQPTTASTPVTQASPVDVGADWKQAMTLNEGEKWKANPETTAGIKEMLTIVDKAQADPSALDPKTVHAELSAALEGLIQKCTMTGPAHDQLHHYLVPLMDNLDKLGKETSASGAAKVVAEIKGQLEGYGEYFE